MTLLEVVESLVKKKWTKTLLSSRYLMMTMYTGNSKQRSGPGLTAKGGMLGTMQEGGNASLLSEERGTTLQEIRSSCGCGGASICLTLVGLFLNGR
jgi:hypothetical protein